jgi:aspartyl-tRNA(Asn)/glutamyl-tRNA(Gln) amidotransferase subunit C
MSLTAEQVHWVANLARLELSDAQLAAMTTQLGRILEYVGQLQQLDTDGIEPMAHALDVTDIFRADELRPSLSADEALANAPKRRGDFYAVPAVFD